MHPGAYGFHILGLQKVEAAPDVFDFVMGNLGALHCFLIYVADEFDHERRDARDRGMSQPDYVFDCNARRKLFCIVQSMFTPDSNEEFIRQFQLRLSNLVRDHLSGPGNQPPYARAIVTTPSGGIEDCYFALRDQFRADEVGT